MKKTSIFLLIIMLVTISVSIFAESPIDGIPGENYQNHVKDDGVIIWTKIDQNGKYDNVPMNRSGYHFDNNDKTNGQEVEMTLQTWAFIPCYLEMKVTGNQGQSMLQSFGPGASANAGTISAYVLAFDNEIGGYVDEDWNSLGHGRNAEIEPGSGKYIQGCDLFKVELYANDNYKYEVESGPLAPTNARADSPDALDSLPLQMRSSIDGAAFGSTVNFEAPNTLVNVIPEKLACQSSLVYHQFRIPYQRNIAHGRYDGKLTLRAFTL